MKRSRFGVSISVELAKALSDAARVYGVARSRIVEEAVDAYLRRSCCSRGEHKCKGVLVAVAERGEQHELLQEALEAKKEVVVTLTHSHRSGECVVVAYIEGSSLVVNSLLAELKKRGVKHEYVPLDH